MLVPELSGILILFLSLLELVVPEVDKKLLEELEAMGFPTARATRALHYSGELITNIDRAFIFIFIFCMAFDFEDDS